MPRFSLTMMFRAKLLFGLAVITIFSGARQANAATEQFIPESDNFRRVLSYLGNGYVDPQRLVPHEMLTNALTSLSYFLPSFSFKVQDNQNLTVFIGDKSKEFLLEEIDTIVQLAYFLEQVAYSIKQMHGDYDDFDRIDQVLLNGILNGLDPHSALLVPSVYVSFSNESQGNYSGVGMIIAPKDSRVVIVKVYSGSPALKGGVRAQDIILEVDGESTLGWTTERVSEKLRGEEGSSVQLLLERSLDEGKTNITTVLVRERIKLKSVFARDFEDDGRRIGYIKIEQFNENTTRDLNAALDDLNIDFSDFSGIVLDLRGNPGGLLVQAIKVSDKFLTEGDIVFVATVDDNIELESKAKPYNTIENIPLAVLIDAESASAAEIVSAALKKNRRAILIGNTSFGKGSVQTVFALPDGSGLKFTDSKYLTPEQVSIQSVGVSPHIHTIPYRVNSDFFSTSPLTTSRLEVDLKRNFVEWGNEVDSARADVSYLYVPPSPESVPNDDGFEQTSWISFDRDFDFLLAKKILLSAELGKSYDDFLNGAYGLAQTENEAQAKKILAALKAQNIDWSASGSAQVIPANAPILKLSLSLADGAVSSKDRFKAGETIMLNVEASNPSSTDLAQTFLRFESESPLVSGRQLALGRIKAGKAAKASLKVSIPSNHSKAAIEYKAVLTNPSQTQLAESSSYFSIDEKPLPMLSYSIKASSLKDGAAPNGTFSVGSEIKLTIALRNSSDTSTGNISLSLKNADSNSIEFLSADSLNSKIEPGKQVEFVHTLRIKDTPPDDFLDFSFASSDSLYPKNRLESSFRIPLGKPFKSISNAPPIVRFIQETSADDGKVALSWEISDDKHWKEVYAFLNDDKVLYLKNHEGTRQRLLNIDLSPLKNKTNKFSIYVKDDEDILSYDTLSFFAR